MRKLLLASLLFCLPAIAWPVGWTHGFKITTQASKLNGVNSWYFLDLDDMPAEFWTAVQADGDDLRFYDNADNPIDHYLVFIGSGTGLVAVAQPHGSTGASTDIDSYVYVGNAGATSTSTNSVFPSTLEALYMLQEQPTSNTAIKDSTSNARHSITIAGGMTSGDSVTGGPHSGLLCLDMDSTDRITVPQELFDDCETAGAFTWFGWVKLRNDSSDRGVFGAAGTQLGIRWDFSSYGFVVTQRNSANNANFIAEDTTHNTASVWYFVSAVYDGSTLKIYVNGVLQQSVTATSLRIASLAFLLGHDNVTYLNAYLGETGIYSAALSADQQMAMYLSETDSAFWVIEEVFNGTAPWHMILLSEE